MDPLSELESLATTLGDAVFVQGAGGNVSVKSDAELWVKASGKRLRDTARDGGFAQVPLSAARGALDGDAAQDALLFAHTPRPSLETYFHALPGAVVAHTHPVRTCLLACSDRAAPAEVNGIPVVDLAYVRPGRGLALAMRERQPSAPGHAFLLRNHGLVVVAPSASRAVAITRHLDESFGAGFAPPRPFPAELAAWLDSPVVPATSTHVARALPARTVHVAHAPRYLFPDAVVYGHVRRVEHASLDAARILVELRPAWFQTSLVLEDDEGHRVAVARNAESLDRMTEILAAHDWLERTLAPTGDARYLPDSEPAALLDLPAEKFRQKLAETHRA